MEELMRFVAIRAPELVHEDGDSSVPVRGSVDFTTQLARAEPEARARLARDFTKSRDFLDDPASDALGRLLLMAVDGTNLSTVSTEELTAMLASVVGGGEKSSEEILREAVHRPEWEALRMKLSDSLLALSFHQPELARSARRYERLIRLMTFAERVARSGVGRIAAHDVMLGVLSANFVLTPNSARAEQEMVEQKNDDHLDLNSHRIEQIRRTNRAANYLLSIPRAKLEPKFEGDVYPPESEPEATHAAPFHEERPVRNLIGLREAVGITAQRVTYAVKKRVLEALDPSVRQTIERQMEVLGVNDVQAALTALRHEERDFYGEIRPMKGVRVRGTTLTMANAAHASMERMHNLDEVLNPGMVLHPKLLGPGASVLHPSLPRYGRLGIGELLVVRQFLKGYRSLDVAHIENVLRGEKKERDHRRKRLTEEVFAAESERQLEDERDTQTSERYEMRSEVNEEVREAFRFDAGLKITAKLGPYVEMEADARFGYENAKMEGRQKATQFSKETTERASTRYAERTLERRERRIVEEVEEINRHSVDAAGAKENVAGIYQWVNKVYEAQVYNYGIRDMYEFFLPEPALFYIGTILAKGLSDGELPAPPPPFSLDPATLNRSNYQYYTSLYGATGVPEPPEEFVKVDLAQAGGPVDPESNPTGQVAAAFSVKLPDGYEFFGFSQRGRYSYKESDSPTFAVVVSDQFGDPGSVPVFVKGKGILSWAVWVHFTCRVTESRWEAWQLSAWEAMREGQAQMHRNYEESLAARAVQQGVEISGRNPQANERIIHDELQRQCITAFANRSPSGNNGVAGGPGNATVDWHDAYKKGLYTRFMQQAFEWENVSYVFYPFFWARKSRWLELFNIEDVDPRFHSFLQSGMARVVVPVRPGFEAHIEHFRRAGEIWSGAEPPTIADPDFLSVAAELQASSGAPGREEPVGEPWEIVVPTQLVHLRGDDRLPAWEMHVSGEWREIGGNA